MGSLGFALTLHPLIEKIKAEFPGLTLNAWYLVDGTLMGPPEDLALFLTLWRGMALPSAFTSIGASLSSLSLRRLTRPSQPLLSDISTTHCGFSLLGCHIGPPPDFCEDVFRSRLVKVRASLGALRDMGDSQLETSLLRSCLALQKIFFVLCTCSPSHKCHTTVDFDCHPRILLSPLWAGLCRTGRG